MKVSTHQFTLGLIAAAVVSLTACGGGGGGTAGVDTTPVTTTVMDGLIYNAVVCVDSNNDGVCQPTETQDRTDKFGKVTLNIPTTEFATAKLIAVVGIDATDMDFPDVKVPVAYTLRTSAGKHSIISPLTDMVQTKMDLDSAKTFEQAENEVKTEKGLDLSVSVTVDFVANRDKDAYKKASDRAREHVLEIQKSKDELSKLHCEHTDEEDSDDDRIRKMLATNSPNASLDLDHDDDVKMACSADSNTKCDDVKKAKIKPAKLSCVTPATPPATPPAAQTITFASPGNQTLGIAAPTLSATSTSGLTVALASTTPSVCTVNGTVLTLVAAGSCTVSANQAGNTGYAAAAAVLRTFTVAAALPPVVVTSAVNGKALYAANGCGSCHGTPPSSLKVLNGANSPIAISSAISGVGSMNSYSGKFSAQNLTDMAAYLATPTI